MLHTSMYALTPVPNSVAQVHTRSLLVPVALCLCLLCVSGCVTPLQDIRPDVETLDPREGLVVGSVVVATYGRVPKLCEVLFAHSTNPFRAHRLVVTPHHVRDEFFTRASGSAFDAENERLFVARLPAGRYKTSITWRRVCVGLMSLGPFEVRANRVNYLGRLRCVVALDRQDVTGMHFVSVDASIADERTRTIRKLEMLHSISLGSLQKEMIGPNECWINRRPRVRQ